jgi:hypothetical protein
MAPVEFDRKWNRTEPSSKMALRAPLSGIRTLPAISAEALTDEHKAVLLVVIEDIGAKAASQRLALRNEQLPLETGLIYGNFSPKEGLAHRTHILIQGNAPFPKAAPSGFFPRPHRPNNRSGTARARHVVS